MFTTDIKKMVLIALCSFSVIACSEAPKEENNSKKQDAALSALAANLKSVDEGFVPESMEVSGEANQTLGANFHSKSQKNEDICKDENGDDELMECQAKMIKFYLRTARHMFRFTHHFVSAIAKGLGQVADGSTGSFVTKEGETIHYTKESFLKFDLLITRDGNSIGYLSVNESSYDIRLDMAEVDEKNPENNQGLFQVAVDFSDKKNWQTNIHITNAQCDPEKSDDPEAIRIEVQRKSDLWKGQTSIYTPRALVSDDSRTCDSSVSDDTGIVLYTDFIGNKKATKAALYMMKRNETSTADLENFGLDGLCTSYPDICDAIALEESTSANAVDQYLSQFSNTHCLKRGEKQVTWGSDCSEYSGQVSELPLHDNEDRIVPNDFYQMSVEIPDSL